MGMLRARSTWTTAIALAVLATPVAAFLALRPDHALTRPTRHARQSTPPLARAPASASQGTPLVVAPSQLVAARASARRFGVQYAGYLAGRLTAREIEDAAAEFVRELRRYPPRVTPAQQRHMPTVRRVTVEPTAATVLAVATLQTAEAPSFQISFVLERRGSRWLVTRLLDT